MNEQIKILCVDDEENVLKALKRLFFDEDYEIITAASAEEGLKILEKEAAQIVISDYRMPQMTGVDFLREVCIHWPDTVRIVLSGYADVSSIISAINEGQIYKFIPKPWNDSDLKVTVSNAIERYFLYKKNRALTLELQKKNEELSWLNVELEKLLEKETASLEFQSRVLRTQQNLLDVLPVGIIGIDFNNAVVMCNSKSIEITRDNQIPLAQNIEDVLPENLLPFIEEVKTKKHAARKIDLNGLRGTLKGALIEHADNQKGVILAFIREEQDT
jgi:two-component system, NtrC family, sensor kinase